MGTFSLTFAQSGSALSGTIRVANSECVADGTISGSVSGTQITFGAVKGAHTIAFSGTLKGAEMSGTYTSPCGPDHGTWGATRA